MSCVGPQVRGRALVADGEHARPAGSRCSGRSSAGRRRTRARSTAGPPNAGDARRGQPGPGDRQLARDRARAGGLEIRDQLRQQPPGTLELDPERATRPQVLLRACSLSALIARHLLATVRRVAGVARCPRARRSRCSAGCGGAAPARSCTIGTPAATISHAVVCRSRCEPTSGIPARRHARRTVEATVPDAIGAYGARACRNTSRRSLTGRPRRRYAAIACADISRQRQPILTAALAVHHQLTGAPVDVIKRQAGDLAAAQPEPQQQDDQRVIAPPERAGDDRTSPATPGRPRG